ncbi:MAG TPA: carbonic anhydrase family protein [Terracidiphilus sp.]|jgi:carbonic anhydrase
MRLSAFLSLLIVMTGVGSAQTHTQPAPTHTHWDYYGKTGPLGWGRLDPEYRLCSEGKEQSPIDIRGAKLNKTLKPIEFHYLTGSVELENNGHTVAVHVNPGSYIVANGVRYDLQQFHFHHPAEEEVNGKLTDMDVHLVHKSAEGKLAVVAVRLSEDRGDPNAALATLWQHLPAEAGKTEKVSDMLNPGGLLPADRGYWTYMGSLTTPPCTEGVRWFVLEQPVSISRSQLRAFEALGYKINSRPVQDRNGRKIEANE